MIVQVTIQLHIDSDDSEKIEEIIQEMDYNFSYIEPDIQKELIIDHYLLEYK